jgi:hypothetical protein
MKQIEIEAIKNFAEKMREFGYAVNLNVNGKPTLDYRPPKYDTEITIGCFKRAEHNDALAWNNLSLSFRLDSPQKHENEG